MTETIQYEQFDEAAPARGQNNHAGSDLARLGEVPMELSVELGRTQLTVAQTLDLRAGAVVPLERPAGAPADLLVNGTPIARGEVVVVDEHYGLRINEILDSDADRAQAAQGSNGAASAAAGADGDAGAGEASGTQP